MSNYNEPWAYDDKYFIKDRHGVTVLFITNNEVAERICACVNFCAGVHPEVLTYEGMQSMVTKQNDLSERIESDLAREE